MSFMGYVAAVDPGARGCGVSLWHEGVLIRAGYVKNPIKKGLGVDSALLMGIAVHSWIFDAMRGNGALFGLGRLAIEVPRIYPAARQKGDQNDLIALALVCGACAAAVNAEDTIQYFPRDWKGTAYPDNLIELVKTLLDPEESKAVTLPRAQGLAHNVWDSVGIGLHYLGRLAPLRVYHKE